MGTRARAHPHVSLASGLVLVSSDVRVAGRLSKTNHITETTGRGDSRGAARVRPERGRSERATPTADAERRRRRVPYYTVNTALFTTTFDFIVKIPRRFMSLAGAQQADVSQGAHATRHAHNTHRVGVPGAWPGDSKVASSNFEVRAPTSDKTPTPRKKHS